MHRNSIWLGAALVSVAAGSALFNTLLADTLTLRDGTTITGTYLGGTAREIRMDLGSRTQSFPVDRVVGIQFDGNGAVAATPVAPVAPSGYSQSDPSYAQPASAPAPPPANTNSETVQPPPPPPAGSYNTSGIVIPAGTPVTVRMIDSVDSDSSRLGRTYRASVDEPVLVNGQVVIPRGADVMTKVVEDQQANKIAGRTAIGLVMQSINVNGRDVPVTTADVRQESASRTKRSAGVIGGGTALGAIIGGIAGGGKGAAIGAISGAAVGTGAEVLTKGEKVHIPAETRLTFTLNDPATI